MRKVASEVARKFNSTKEDGAKHRGAIEKAFEKAGRRRKIAIDKAENFITKRHSNYYVATQKVLKAWPEATQPEVKHILEHAKGAMDKNNEDLMEKAWRNFNKSREQPQPPQAPKQDQGDSDWNILTKFCAEKKKGGSGPLKIEEMVAYLAPRSLYLRKMCRQQRSRFWPEAPQSQGEEEPDRRSWARQAEEEPAQEGEEETMGRVEPDERDEELSAERKKALEMEPKKLDDVEGIKKGLLGRANFPSKNLWFRAKARAETFECTKGQMFRIEKGGIRKRVLRNLEDIEEAIATAHGKGGHLGRSATLETVKGACW